MVHPLLLFLLLAPVLTQNNVCYANCKPGFCQPTSALACTDCDLGLVNLNNMCIGSSTQAAPLTYLKPNSKNIIMDSPSAVLNCSVSNRAAGSTVPMIFSPTIGSTFTRAFNIPFQHVYLQVKFNSIIAAVNSTPSSPTLEINVFTSDGKNIYTNVKSFTNAGNAVSCSSGYRAFDVFNVGAKLTSSETTVLVEVRSTGTTNTKIALSDVELYYGNCSAECGLCNGPTNKECTSCRGLLTTLSNSQCSGCAAGFYQNGICMPCPIQCDTCAYSNNQVKCLICRTDIASNSTTSPLGCATNYAKMEHAIDQQFTNTDWSSSEASGNIVTQCGFYSLIAGISIGVSFSSISKTFTDLPAHTQIYFYFTLFLIDQSLGDSNAFSIALDENLLYDNFTITTSATTNLTNECGTEGYEVSLRKKFVFTHNASSGKVQITFLKDYAGIRDVVLVVNNQTSVSNCFSESNGTCTACRNGYQLANNSCTSCGDGYYEQSKLCKICPITCKTCNSTNGIVQCLTCQTPLTLDGIYCVDSTNSLYIADIVENVTDFSRKTSWRIYPHLQDNGIDSCDGTPMMGSSDILFKFLSMKRTFTGLPAHTGVTIFFQFYQIDDYSNDQSVKFILNSKTTIYTPSNLKMNLCGNITADALVPIYLTDSTHSASTLDFQVSIARMGKIGVKNIMVYLLNSGNDNAPPFTIQSVPSYSVNTPPVKGLTVKLSFPDDFVATVDTNKAFDFYAKSADSSSRLLQSETGSPVFVQNSTINNNRELLYLLDLTKDYSNGQLSVRARRPDYIYFQDGSGNKDLIPQQLVTATMPRYVDMDTQNVNNRSSTRNLFNLFRGCAIVALFLGIASFLFGMSSIFDDFLLLCQLIFVHVFIQYAYNPPSIIIPFGGLHIVQFLEWLPWPARQGIQSAIIPNNLYQVSPLVYEQFYEDIVFARTFYQPLLYLILVLALWTIMHVLLMVWNAKNPATKYSNYFLYYYHNYDSKKLALLDKIVRFAYFSIIWACVLQCTHLSNQPKSFNVWNTILTIVFFVAVLVYPVVIFLLLRRAASTLSAGTFNKSYEELRVSSESLYYYLVRYYKLVVIACIIGFLHAANPVIPLIVLIVINLADALLLIFIKPLGMVQPQLIEASVFYPLYPAVYYYTMVIQQILFIILQILFLVLYGQRDGSSSSVYMGIGYAICVFVIILLLNGLFRLFWGFMKHAQQCNLQRQSFEQSVEKQVEENRDPAQEHPIIENAYKSQQNLSRRDLSRLQSKKMSYVSKLRV